MTDLKKLVKPSHRKYLKKVHKINKRTQRNFLELLRMSFNFNGSARALGFNPSSFRMLMERDPEFARAVEEAHDEAVGELEAALYDRAVNGVEKPIFARGEKIGSIREYSDSVGMFLLKNNNTRYRDTSSIEISGKNGGPIELSEAKTKLLDMLKKEERDITGECEKIED